GTNDMIETFETEGSIEEEFVDVLPDENDVQETSAWTASSTKMLICLRGQYNAQFDKSKKKGQKALIWKKVTDEMKQVGYYFGASQCDEKWRRLLSRYRQVMRDVLSPLARQAVSPPKDLLHESSDGQLASSSSTTLIPTPQIEVLASTSIQKPTLYIDKITQPKAPVWFQQFEGLKNKQLDAINKNATQLNDRFDKLEKREEAMLLIQEQLVSKLNEANNIELQHLELFKQMFNLG
ncbi:trihelix transcription factor GT-3b-like, partial [Aphis craccivora]